MTEYRLAQVADYLCTIELAVSQICRQGKRSYLRQVFWRGRIIQEKLAKAGTKEDAALVASDTILLGR